LDSETTAQCELFFLTAPSRNILTYLHVQVTKLKVCINETISSGTRAVKEIYENHPRLDDAKREELIQQTELTFHKAAWVLVVHKFGSTKLHQRSDELPKWIKYFEEFTHYRSVCIDSFLVCIYVFGRR